MDITYQKSELTRNSLRNTRWATRDWSWPEEWDWCARANSTLKGGKGRGEAQAGNEKLHLPRDSLLVSDTKFYLSTVLFASYLSSLLTCPKPAPFQSCCLWRLGRIHEESCEDVLQHKRVLSPVPFCVWLICMEDLHAAHGLNGYVLSGSQYNDFHCPVLHSVQLHQTCSVTYCCET